MYYNKCCESDSKQYLDTKSKQENEKKKKKKKLHVIYQIFHIS
jgi:hypothetical protein